MDPTIQSGMVNFKIFEASEAISKPQIISRNWDALVNKRRESQHMASLTQKKNPLQWSHCRESKLLSSPFTRRVWIQSSLNRQLHATDTVWTERVLRGCCPWEGLRPSTETCVWGRERRRGRREGEREILTDWDWFTGRISPCGPCSRAGLKEEWSFSQKIESNHCFIRFAVH